MITDLTTGNVSKTLFTFTIPMFLSVVFQQLYSMADSIIAGRFAGKNALAAVGASYPITMIFIAIATGSCMGCSVIISQCFGEKQFVKMKTAINTSMIAVMSLGLFLTIAGTIFCNSLIRLLNTPQNIFIDSADYLRIYIFGLLFLFLYNICNGIFTALGDSKTPLYFLIFSSVLNIILDLLFVIQFQMGVKGVAWATFIAQGIASFLAFYVIRKRLRQFSIPEKIPFFSADLLKRISIVAIPSILQQSFISVGNLLVQILINGLGADIIAGFSAGMKLNTFCIISNSTLGNAVSSFTAQNIGAKKTERVKEGFITGWKMAVVISLVFSVLFFFFSRQMITLFVDPSETAVISAGSQFLRVVSPFYLLICVKLISDGVLRGAGAMGPFMVCTFSDLILRVVLSFLLVIPFQATGIWMSWPIGWIIGTILSFAYYKRGVWKPSEENYTD